MTDLVYQKLNAARLDFHGQTLKKTGRNTFSNYSYFELGDFLVPALQVFGTHGLCSIVSFTTDTATMRIVCIEDGSSIVLTSPMGSAALKGCHEVQNIGAVETYQRRYLWVAALEIVEHDALDATTGSDKVEKPSFVTADQADEIIALASKVGVEIGKICAAYKVETITRLPADKYDSAITRLNKSKGE